MITLYDYEWSSDCYKARLLLSMLGVHANRTPIEVYPAREHVSAKFLNINPLGSVPVIEDGSVCITDAQLILIYLASKYDPKGEWYPAHDPALLGELTRWLSFAGQLSGTAGAARLHESLSWPVDIEAARSSAHRLLRRMDEHLWFVEQDGGEWLCAWRRPTIADIACFPDVVLSEEGGVSRQDYPAVRRWCDRVKRLSGFQVMSGVFPAGSARAA